MSNWFPTASIKDPEARRRAEQYDREKAERSKRRREEYAATYPERARLNRMLQHYSALQPGKLEQMLKHLALGVKEEKAALAAGLGGHTIFMIRQRAAAEAGEEGYWNSLLSAIECAKAQVHVKAAQLMWENAEGFYVPDNTDTERVISKKVGKDPETGKTIYEEVPEKTSTRHQKFIRDTKIPVEILRAHDPDTYAVKFPEWVARVTDQERLNHALGVLTELGAVQDALPLPAGQAADCADGGVGGGEEEGG